MFVLDIRTECKEIYITLDVSLQEVRKMAAGRVSGRTGARTEGLERGLEQGSEGLE